MNQIRKVFKFIAFELEGKGAPDQPTIYGITQKNYPKLYNKIKSLDDASAEHKLIELAVLDSYQQLYQKYKANKLFYPLSVWYFDHAFNAGVKSAVEILQACLNIHGSGLKVDGIWGKKTQKAYDSFVKRAGVDWLDKFENQYLVLRRWKYTHTQPFKWRCGWINRTIRLEMFVRYGFKRIPI